MKNILLMCALSAFYATMYASDPTKRWVTQSQKIEAALQARTNWLAVIEIITGDGKGTVTDRMGNWCIQKRLKKSMRIEINASDRIARINGHLQPPLTPRTKPLAQPRRAKL